MMARLYMAWCRWRCDHFDHPYRQVRDVPVATTDDPAEAMRIIFHDLKHCNYCHRDFEMPVFHPNCKCSLVVPDEGSGSKWDY